MPVSIPVSIESPIPVDLRFEGGAEFRDPFVESSSGMLVQFEIERISIGDQGVQSPVGWIFVGPCSRHVPRHVAPPRPSEFVTKELERLVEPFREAHRGDLLVDVPDRQVQVRSIRGPCIGLDAGESSDLTVVEFGQGPCFEELFERRAPDDRVVAVVRISKHVRVGGSHPGDGIAEHGDHTRAGREMLAESDAAMSAEESNRIGSASSKGFDRRGMIVGFVPVEREVQDARPDQSWNSSVDRCHDREERRSGGLRDVYEEGGARIGSGERVGLRRSPVG